jgi:hypothetical protein
MARLLFIPVFLNRGSREPWCLVGGHPLRGLPKISSLFMGNYFHFMFVERSCKNYASLRTSKEENTQIEFFW